MAVSINVRFVRKEDIASVHRILTQPEVIWGTLQFSSRRVESLGRMVEISEDSFSLVAEIADGPEKGKVVGNAGMHRGSGRKRHVAGLGMVVDSGYHGQGIGTALLGACLETARRWWSPVRMELEVYPDNKPALALYRKLGFEVEGTKREAVMRKGAYVDLLVMSLIQPQEAAGQGVAPHQSGIRGTAPEPGRSPCGDVTTTTPVSAAARFVSRAVRPPGPGDIPGIRRLYENPAVLRDSPFLPWTIPTPDKIREDLEKAAERHVLIWAEGDSVYGEISFSPGRFRTARTAVASLRCVPPGHRGFSARVARDLLQAATDLCDNWLGLHRLEVETYADELWLFDILNEAGFHTEARLRKASLRDGVFEDRLVWGRICETW